METSAAAKSKKIRDYAALALPALLQALPPGETTEWAAVVAWIIAEKMYEKEVETYDRCMKEEGCTRQSLAKEFSAIAARRGSTSDA